MFAIGEFARHGRVSIRVLRHYDAIGLLQPAALPIAERPDSRQRLSVVDLSEIPAAATLIHHGSMDNVLPSIQALADGRRQRIPVTRIFGWLGARGIAPAGPPFFRYHVIDMEHQLLVEAGVPVESAVQDDGDVKSGTLPSGQFAVMTHTGAPQTLMAATSALLDWAEAGGLAFDVARTDVGEKWGCRLESYLTNPAEQPDTSKWQTS